MTVTPETTSVTGLSAPATARAFDPIDVTATVAAAFPALHPSVPGRAELRANNVPFAYTTVVDGIASFSNVTPPASASTLSVAYIGDETGNFAESVSAASPIAISHLETDPGLTVSPTAIQADEPARCV